MNDEGFNGAGSRFGSRFEAGSPILAKQLNDLASGLQASLPMPYLGDGSVVSYTPGGALITPTDNEVNNTGKGNEYVNQFQCLLEKAAAEGGDTIWTLQIAKGTLIYEDEHQAFQTPFDRVSTRSECTIVDGEDSESPYMNSDGYCVLDEGRDWGVYILQIRSQDRVKFRNYLYVADSPTFVYPETDFVAYDPGDIPGSIDAPTVAYSMQVISIASIVWDDYSNTFSLTQELVGSQTLPPAERPAQFQVEIINREKDPTLPPYWGLRIAKGVVMSPPDTAAGCIGVEWVDAIDHRCNPAPVPGDYADSPYTDNGGLAIVYNDTDYAVYLFRVTTVTDGVTSNELILWIGVAADFTDDCPVTLPSNIEPSGDYTAQAIHIATATQPYSADTWVIEQVVSGTITFPAYAPDVCTPFKVRKISSDAGSATYEVCEGTLNNVVPSNIADPIVADGGADTFIWIVAGVGTDTPTTFPDPDNVTIDSGSTIPYDTDEEAYVGIAHIQTDGTVSALVRGSLWGSRIKIGDDDALYYYAGI